MEQAALTANERIKDKKRETRRMRRSGRIPAVVYGQNEAPHNIVLDEHELEMLLRGADYCSQVVNLALEGGKQKPTVIREIQRHPVTQKLIHVDFFRINLEEEIDMQVNLHVVGEQPQGVRDGGILETLSHSVNVRCKPMAIPQYIEVDLSKLGIGDTLHVSDLVVPEGVEILEAPEEALYSVHLPAMPSAEEEEEGAEEEVAAEPEVIGEKKEEGAEEGSE